MIYYKQDWQSESSQTRKPWLGAEPSWHTARHYVAYELRSGRSLETLRKLQNRNLRAFIFERSLRTELKNYWLSLTLRATLWNLISNFA